MVCLDMHTVVLIIWHLFPHSHSLDVIVCQITFTHDRRVILVRASSCTHWLAPAPRVAQPQPSRFNSQTHRYDLHNLYPRTGPPAQSPHAMLKDGRGTAPSSYFRSPRIAETTDSLRARYDLIYQITCKGERYLSTGEKRSALAFTPCWSVR